MPKKTALAAFASFLFANISHAAGDIYDIILAVGDLCDALNEIVPIIAMLLVIGSAVVYAAGQVLGAETRARAATWATAMLVGAIIAILIVVIVPQIITVMYGCGITCGGAMIICP